jgi:hypothetical protein
MGNILIPACYLTVQKSALGMRVDEILENLSRSSHRGGIFSFSLWPGVLIYM